MNFPQTNPTHPQSTYSCLIVVPSDRVIEIFGRSRQSEPFVVGM